MINAKELRIGNLVEYKITDEFDDRKEWWEVSEIDADDIHWLSKVDVKDEDFRPIPLTEEWLQKLGFELKGFYRLKVTSFLELCWKPHDNTLNLQTEKNGFTEDSKCKYVHQLQNLYFVFTQRELTVA